MQEFFITAEFALAMILLIGAGLLIHSFSKLAETSPGFRADHLLTMSVPLSFERYSNAAQVRQLCQQAIERIAGLPGVNAVAGSNDLLLKAHRGPLLHAGRSYRFAASRVIKEAVKLVWPREDVVGKRLGHYFPNMVRTVTVVHFAHNANHDPTIALRCE